MYRFAYKNSDEFIFYFDAAGNKYVASGGNLAWRINNPGLVSSHSHFSRNNGSIGSCGHYAIFSNPQDGRKALAAWIHSKKYYNSTLKTIATHYRPDAPDIFLNKLSSFAKISPTTKVKLLSKEELDRLLVAIEKLCGYASQGDESFSLLPKIIAKIENGRNQEDTYLVGNSIILSKKEVVEWILSHRLDGVLVHEQNGKVHFRSRPSHCIWNIEMDEKIILPTAGLIDTLVRSVGENKPGQCIWGFINGIGNSRESALESANQISTIVGGEKVLSMPNDTVLWGLKDLIVCCVLKITIHSPIVEWAVKFLRYLLTIAKDEVGSSAIIVFVHSQGAIITEHALELLQQSEREKLRIFTFGGGSFLLPGKSHSDTHNFASAADFVCRLGSINHQYLALERYYGDKEGLSDHQVIHRMAMADAMLDLNTIDPKVIEAYAEQRSKHYEIEFSKIDNVTILDPDPDSKWKHRFSSDCYQAQVKATVKKYRKNNEVTEAR